MYDGNEKVILNGEYLDYSMLDFWRWAYSNIHYNMQRGTFADYLVRCALERGGFPTRPEIGTGFEPYDLEGPIIPATGKPARIEVKSAGVLQAWGKSSRIAFSIAPARIPENGESSTTPRSSGTMTFTSLHSSLQKTRAQISSICIGGSSTFCVRSGSTQILN